MPRGVYERAPRAIVVRPFEPCSIDGCEKDANRRGPQLCEMHYIRIRRAERRTPYVKPPRAEAAKRFRKPAQERRRSSDDYWVIQCPGHPLVAGKDRQEDREHRVVFYDAHGVGPFNCHWCGIERTWENLHIDHLDDDKGNNSLSNLVVACLRCNTARGLQKMRATQRDRYATKLTFEGVTKTLSEWASAVGIAKNSLAYRLKSGWSLERALTEPRGATGPRVGCEGRTRATPRRSMTDARRRAVWVAGDKRCAGCEKPVSLRGGTVVDHILPLELGGLDEPTNLQMLCTDCDRGKTRWDAKRIAKMRRQSKMHEDKPSTFKPGRKLQSAGFNTNLRKKLDGSVVRKVMA